MSGHGLDDDRVAVERRLARGAPWLLLAYGLTLWLTGLVTVPSAVLATVLTVASWLLTAGVLLLAAGGLAAARMPRWAVPLALVAALAWWWILSHQFGDPPPPLAGAAATVGVVTAAVLLGRMIAWLFREVKLLLPALLLAGPVDFWTVNHGFVAKVAEEHLDVIIKASAVAPAVGSDAAGYRLGFDLLIGPGDWVVMGLILTLVATHRLDWVANLRWIYGLTVVGLTLVVATGWMIPGLVFIGLAGIVANRQSFQYTATEKRDLAIAAGLVAVLLTAASLALWRAESQSPPAETITEVDENNHGDEPEAPVRVPGD